MFPNFEIPAFNILTNFCLNSIKKKKLFKSHDSTRTTGSHGHLNFKGPKQINCGAWDRWPGCVGFIRRKVR